MLTASAFVRAFALGVMVTGPTSFHNPFKAACFVLIVLSLLAQVPHE